jgi:hypothetical protein
LRENYGRKYLKLYRKRKSKSINYGKYRSLWQVAVVLVDKMKSKLTSKATENNLQQKVYTHAEKWEFQEFEIYL